MPITAERLYELLSESGDGNGFMQVGPEPGFGRVVINGTFNLEAAAEAINAEE